MPGNVVGQAWVEIRPDLSGFSAELTAGLTDAIAKAQAYVDTRPLQFRAQVDTAQAVAAVMAAGTAMQAAATANPITFDASIDMAKALAQLALLRAAAASAGGGDGGGVAPVPLPGRSDRGGQGGGSTVGYLAAAGGAALLLGTLTKILGVGAGMTTLFGVTMPAAFSVLSLAGLGFEHVLATILGLAASLTGAIGGGLLLALGAVGVAAVGMGSDLAVMKSTIADTQTLYKALETLRQAVIQYGAGSAQAAAAQTALNVQIQMLGNTAGVAAELALAKSVQALNIYWDQATSGARVAAVGILQQFLTVAQQYIPLVASAATRNFGIIQQAIQPLMAYLAGPAKQIFQNLENVFAQNLPASIHALSMGIELVLKTINFLSQYVGGATQAIDKLLTSANSSTGFIKWEGIMQTLIGLFHTWWDFFSILGKDMIDVFSLTAGLGQSIIQDLTTMLTKLHDWLQLTTTQTSLHNLFEVHKQEVQELLALLPVLFSGLGHVYLALAPALTTALATVLGALVPILTIVTSNAWGAWAVGLGLILAKFGALGTVLGPVGSLIKNFVGSLLGIQAASAATTVSLKSVEGGLTLTAQGFHSVEGGVASASGATRTWGSLLSSVVNPWTLGIAAAAVGAALLATHWDQVTTAVRDVFDPTHRMVDEMKALDQVASTNYLSNLKADTQGFTDAVTSFNNVAISQGLLQHISTLNSQIQFYTQLAAPAADATTHLTATVSPAQAAWNAASSAVGGARDAIQQMAQTMLTAKAPILSTLNDMTINFGRLSPQVQATLDMMDKYGASAGQVATAYKGLMQVQTIGIPTWDAQNRLVGLADSGTSSYAGALQHLADTTNGPVGSAAANLHLAYLQEISDYQAAGGALGQQGRAIQGALPLFQALISQLTQEALAHGASQQAATAQALALATKLDPAGASATQTIQAMATASGNSLAVENLLIQNDPSLIAKFLADQTAVKNASGDWYTLTGAEQAAAAAEAAFNRISVSTPGGVPTGFRTFSHGGVINASSAGEAAILHGTEAIMPKDITPPWLWQANLGVLSGRPPQESTVSTGAVPALTLPSLPPSLVSGNGGSVQHLPPVQISQGDIHLHGYSTPEIVPAIRQEIQRNNRDLIAALRSR